MVREITATALARLLESRSILALIHVREHDEYNLAHHWRRYALLGCPADQEKKRTIDQRPADAHITPLWYPDGEHDNVEPILQLLLD
jgi:hypothetical protein